ncbi:MAG: PIG-L deacetylase family protein [Pyrinomonadaceae bacterium]
MSQPLRRTRRRKAHSAHAKLFGSGELNPIVRCSVIVAHPADEVVGAGCLISKLPNVSVLHITDGAPPDIEDAKAAGFEQRSEYAKARKQECLSALALANVPETQVVDLEVASHCAPQCLADLAKKVAAFLQQSAADIVVTHPYEGGHPDHDATAFATHAAVRLMKQSGLQPPEIFEMALHPSTDFKAKVPDFLPGPARETTTLLLDEKAQELKQRMFACFQTQRDSLEVSPIGPEKFRQPATYDFSAPPQSGRLYYENFDWAIRSDEWKSLACKALADLFPPTQLH